MNKDLDHLHRRERDVPFLSIFDAAIDGLIVSDLETGLIVEANPAACMMHGYTREEFIGLELGRIIHFDNQSVFIEHTRKSQSDAILDIQTLDVCRNSDAFHAEWRGSAFTYHGHAWLLSIVRDVSKRMSEEHLLHKQEEIRAHEQATLLEISHTLASTLEFKPGLILEQLKEIVDYTFGGLFTLEDSMLVALALHGTPQLEQSLPFRIHLDSTETLTTLFNGYRSIRIANIWDDSLQSQFLRRLLDDGAAQLLKGMQAWMWVPLIVRSRIIGSIGVAHEKRNHFTAHQADLALSVANQAATTMANAELNRNAQALAVLEERQRLAQNLHDAVNQSLFSAGLIADVLPRLWDRDQDEARKSLDDLRRLTRAAQAEMRALLAELRPSALTDTDLGDLFHLLANALSGRINIPVKVNVAKDVILPAETQVAFYRICQEVLNNVAKHAKASQVDIDLVHEGSAIELRIRDDGMGFNPEETFAGHYGLSMMRERAEAVGAQLSITSQTGHGTEFILCWANDPQKE